MNGMDPLFDNNFFDPKAIMARIAELKEEVQSLQSEMVADKAALAAAKAVNSGSENFSMEQLAELGKQQYRDQIQAIPEIINNNSVQSDEHIHGEASYQAAVAALKVLSSPTFDLAWSKYQTGGRYHREFMRALSEELGIRDQDRLKTIEKDWLKHVLGIGRETDGGSGVHSCLFTWEIMDLRSADLYTMRSKEIRLQGYNPQYKTMAQIADALGASLSVNDLFGEGLACSTLPALPAGSELANYSLSENAAAALERAVDMGLAAGGDGPHIFKQLRKTHRHTIQVNTVESILAGGNVEFKNLYNFGQVTKTCMCSLMKLAA